MRKPLFVCDLLGLLHEATWRSISFALAQPRSVPVVGPGFAVRYPGVKVFDLTGNYWATRQVLDCATLVAQEARHQAVGRLLAHRRQALGCLLRRRAGRSRCGRKGHPQGSGRWDARVLGFRPLPLQRHPGALRGCLCPRWHRHAGSRRRCLLRQRGGPAGAGPLRAISAGSARKQRGRPPSLPPLRRGLRPRPASR